MRKLALCLLTSLLAFAVATPVLADRNFPPRAARGEMKAFQYPYVKIGSRTLRLSPGSRIFNEQNMIVMPVSVQAQKAQVMYSIDMNGDLDDLWLLTAQEARARPLPKAPPAAGGTGGTKK